MQIEKIASGIYLEYNPKTDPFFKANVDDALRRLAASKTFNNLLKTIKASQPAITNPAFPRRCKVLICAPLARKYSPTVADPNVTVLSLNSKTSAAEVNSAAATGGATQGSSSWVYWSNKEYRTAPAHISFAHELIHACHAACGTMKSDNKQEEYFTVGIHGHEDAELTENRIRQELNMPLRATYFEDDPQDYTPMVWTSTTI